MIGKLLAIVIGQGLNSFRHGNEGLNGGSRNEIGGLVQDLCQLNRLVKAPPAFDDDPSLSKRVEDSTIEKFIKQSRIEALNQTILQRAIQRCIVA